MFDKLYGIDDLEKDISQFKVDIYQAQANYQAESDEFVKIASNFDTTVEKYEYLQAQAQTVSEIFPEDRDIDGESALSARAKEVEFSALVIESGAFAAWISKKFYAWRLTKAIRKIDNIDDVMLKLAKLGKAADKFEDIPKLYRTAQIAKASKLAKTAKVASAARVAKFLGAVGFVVGVVGVALEIVATEKRRDFLREHRNQLSQRLDEINGYIEEANADTKDVIEAFLAYFKALGIEEIDGVFNDNLDGFAQRENFDGSQAFDKALQKLRGALNGDIADMGALNSKIEDARSLIIALMEHDPGDNGIAEMILDMFGQLQGTQLIERVSKVSKGVPQEIIQRLYVLESFARNKSMQEVVEETELPEETVQKIYARVFCLDSGKTVDETIAATGLPESTIRQLYVSKLLDDQLNAENPEDVLDIESIAQQANVSVEVVRQVRFKKLGSA